jgi:hypothetical protein
MRQTWRLADVLLVRVDGSEVKVHYVGWGKLTYRQTPPFVFVCLFAVCFALFC